MVVVVAAAVDAAGVVVIVAGGVGGWGSRGHMLRSLVRRRGSCSQQRSEVALLEKALYICPKNGPKTTAPYAGSDEQSIPWPSYCRSIQVPIIFVFSSENGMMLASSFDEKRSPINMKYFWPKSGTCTVEGIKP